MQPSELTSPRERIERGRISGPFQYLEFTFSYETTSVITSSEQELHFNFGSACSTESLFDRFYSDEENFITQNALNQNTGTSRGTFSGYLLGSRKGSSAYAGSIIVNGASISYLEFQEQLKYNKMIATKLIFKINEGASKKTYDIQGYSIGTVSSDIQRITKNNYSFQSFKDPKNPDGSSRNNTRNLIIPCSVILDGLNGLYIPIPASLNFNGGFGPLQFTVGITVANWAE